MKSKHPFILFLMFFSIFCVAQTTDTKKMTLTGFYYGKNVTIKNNFCNEGGFNLKEVRVNGIISNSEINAELVEIKLDEPGLKLTYNDALMIELYYKDNCSPRNVPLILNPGCIYCNTYSKDKNQCVIEINGIFSVDNLFIFNPEVTGKGKRSISLVKINGKEFKTDLSKEIVSFSLLLLSKVIMEAEGREDTSSGFNEDDPVKIEVFYTKNYDPTLLNPEIFSPWK